MKSKNTALRVMLDAGHGHNTPGKRSPDGMREFEFNSRVADVMKAELEKYEGVTVYFAHEQGRDVPLKERTDKANRLGVDLYFSIHANANTGVMGDWGGIETHVYKTKPAEAGKLAQKVNSALVKATGLRDRGVKFTDLHVTRETNMTAILVEHGFMDSRTDLPKLKSDVYRGLCGVINAKTIAEFYGLKLKQAPQEASNDDVNGHWAEKPIKKALENEIMNGYPDGRFGSDEGLTRAEFVTVLDRLGLLDKGAK